MNTGGYTEGYDAGLRDGKEGRERAIPKLKRRPSATRANWAVYRVGYDDGYHDGLIVLARRQEREDGLADPQPVRGAR